MGKQPGIPSAHSFSNPMAPLPARAGWEVRAACEPHSSCTGTLSRGGSCFLHHRLKGVGEGGAPWPFSIPLSSPLPKAGGTYCEQLNSLRVSGRAFLPH